MFNVKLLKKLMTKDKTVRKSSTLTDIAHRYDKVKISDKLSDFDGIGEEILLGRDNEVIAVFLDGNFKTVAASSANLNEKTK